METRSAFVVRLLCVARRCLRGIFLCWAGCLATEAIAANAAPREFSVGIARVDITPDYPIRLTGFLSRRKESEGTRQQIWAKALAIASDHAPPAVVITVDNLGIPDEMVRQLAATLKTKAGLEPDRLAVTATHTHTAPMLVGVAPNIFGEPVPPAHQEHVDRYTRELAGHLERVALAALKDRAPARLSWGIGSVGFAVNRRTAGGPVDHDLPVLFVHSLQGQLQAIYANYACHCVTLSDNLISGDWAGYAQEHIERNHPGTVALISVGCGADSNPSSGVTGDKGDVASRQGVEVATEVGRLLKGPLRPITGKLSTGFERIELAFDKPPSRDEFAEKAKRTDAIGYHARVQLARLDAGEKLRERISYPVQTWAFGDSLAMVFLPGEVVVDYALRLKRELDGRRLWVNAYANAAPCYIPSERILREGGYEAGDAMVYYDQPARLATGVEQKIVDAVKKQLDQDFHAAVDSQRTRGTRPLAPEQSMGHIQTRPGLTVDLVAAEPLITSPVAIDFGPDGKLWVAEMYDYPSGLDGKFQPGGRVRLLESTGGDGRFDKATVFLEGIPFPTGVTVWRKGLLVCAAPDILFAEDTDGDGRADVVKKLFSGFGVDNYQARVNSLEYGLDGWVYGSCGLFGGNIKSFAFDKPIALGDRDFRIKPDTGEIEPATGRTQQGRVRDDWDNWFGCDNSTLCRHYPLADHYLRRNPHAAFTDTAVFVPQGPDPSRLFPAKAGLQLFKLSGPPGRATAACGLGIYRDNLLGPEFTGNTFTCEPVNLLVHRLQLQPRGSTFAGHRAADEQESEFLSSTDNWFRPVQARTGPDGALWIVDMYRFVIEHPRWIPPEDLAQLDVRAGHDLGRIYSVRPIDKPLAKWPTRLDQLETRALPALLESSNGWQRDMVTQLLLWRNDESAVPLLERLATQSTFPLARLHALCILDGLGYLDDDVLQPALADRETGIRRHAVRLAEKRLNETPVLAAAVNKLRTDPDAQVRLQVACALGALRDAKTGAALVGLAHAHADDPFMVAAVFSSLRSEHVPQATSAAFELADADPRNVRLVERTLEVTAAVAGPAAQSEILRRVVTPRDGSFAPWQFVALAALLEQNTSSLKKADAPTTKQAQKLLGIAREIAGDDAADLSLRLKVLRLLGRDEDAQAQELKLLSQLLDPRNPAELQSSAASAIGRIPRRAAAETLVAEWQSRSPALKAQILDLLLASEAWTAVLLAGIEQEDVPAAQIDPTRRQQLLAHRNAIIRAQAAKLFAGSINPDRQKVLDSHQDVLSLPGDKARGEAVFLKTCAVCHRLGTTGHPVGPDLAALANKSPPFLLQEILDPNRNVDSRFVEYVAVTKAGKSLNGLLASESATAITLKGQEAKQQTLLRADLDELRGTGKSLMPEGLEKDLSHQNLADLIAFLTSSTPPPKQFAGNQPTVVKPAKGIVSLLATTAEIYGDSIAFEAPFRNIGYWHSPLDHVVWTVELEQAAEFDVWLDWACDPGSAGNPYILEGAEAALRGTVSETGGWDRYHQAKVGQIKLAAGRRRLSIRPDAPAVKGAVFDLREVRLVPPGDRPVFAVAAADEPVPSDPATAAAKILDDQLQGSEREALVKSHLDHADQLIAAMTRDLRPETPEEYRRIPWIWRVAIASGKQNDAPQLRKLLKVSLPAKSEPLHDWQAVVIGGGIINGISQKGVFPGFRLRELLKDDPDLSERFARLLTQAAEMADNEKVPTGTRYDALRIIPLDDWKKCRKQLTKYLARGTHDELQMGAISGLSDVDVPEVAGLLLEGLPHFSEGNRKLATDALLRTESRTAALLTALEQKTLPLSLVGATHRQALRDHKNEKLRSRARQLLPTP